MKHQNYENKQLNNTRKNKALKAKNNPLELKTIFQTNYRIYR